MRARTRWNTGNASFNIKGVGSYAILTHEPNDQYAGYSNYSYMYDDDSSPQSRAFKACIHKKCRTPSFLPSPTYVRRQSNSQWYEAEWLGPNVLQRDFDPLEGIAPDWSSMMDDLGRRCEGSLKRDAMLGVTLRELFQTYRMVRNPFGLLKRGWRTKAGRNPAAALIKSGSNIWLEGRYGWNGAYRDIKAFAKATASVNEHVNLSPYDSDPEDVLRFSSSEEGEVAAPVPTISDEVWAAEKTAFPTGSDGLRYRAVFEPGRWKATLSAKRQRRSIPPLNWWRKVSSAYGLSSKDVVDTLWEIVPYSFVVDWFVNTDVVWHNIYQERLKKMGLSQIGYSVKAVLPYRIEILPCSPGAFVVDSADPPVLKSLSDGLTSSYDRIEGWPAAESFFSDAGLSLIQQADGVSLIIQNLIS